MKAACVKSAQATLAMAAVPLVCCLGLSLLAAAGTTALLGFIGVALPVALLIGAAISGAWAVRRRIRPD